MTLVSARLLVVVVLVVVEDDDGILAVPTDWERSLAGRDGSDSRVMACWRLP